MMTSESMVDLISQALKCLSERCPFDGEEQLSRVPTLPCSVAAHLSKHSGGKRKFKKSASTHGGGDGGALLPAVAAAHSSKHSGKSSGMWEAMEPYFRPIKESDIAVLKPKLPPGSCFEIPVLEGLEVAEVGPSFVQVEERSGEKAEAMEIDTVENFTSGSASRKEVPVQEEERVEKEKEKVKEKAEEEEEEEKVEVEVKEGKEEKEEEEEEETLSWVLGSKHRMVLTTQRPTKKRKLLGTDAGLDQLLLLPKKEESSSSSSAVCDVCCLGESEGKLKGLISCSSCSALVHKKCYGVVGDVEEDTWLCSWCKYLEGMEEEKRNEEKGLRGCVLCSKVAGALKMVGGDSGSEGEKKKFAHLFCSVWTPEVHVEDIRAMEPVLNVGGVPEMRTKLVCNVCKVKLGVCVRCSHGTCRTAFHPICAREARHHMEIWGKFGCDNVELRAFCSKHPQDVGSAQQTRNLTEINTNTSSNAKPLSETLLPNKLPKLRFSRKIKEKNMTQSEIVSTVSSAVGKNEKTLEKDALAPKRSPKGGDMQMSKNLNTGVIDGDNNLPDISNLVQVMKKLIDRGKIFVGDVASELGISSDSLEAALMGEISSFPLELGLKIAKWFQGSIYLPASMRQLKFRNGTAISSGSLAARVDCPNAVDVQGLDIPPGAKGLHPDNGDACSIESLPPCGIIDNNIGNLKEEKTTCSSGKKNAQSTKGELVDVVSDDQIIHTVVAVDDLIGTVSPVHDQSHTCKDQVLLETISKETVPGSSPSQVLAPQPEGNSTMVGKDEMSNIQLQPECTAKNLVSTELGNGQTDVALTNTCSDDAVKKGRNNGSCSSSYVHPYIQRRLMQVEEDILTVRESGQSNTNGHSENIMLSAKASDSSNHYLPPGCTNMDCVVDPREVNQLTMAKNMGILELSPEDELEGEIIYLQNKLLDNAVSIKHGFEGLTGRVVQKLPREIEALKKQQWDSVLINQYLREVREQKKRGRKERKHREAQAVLAAAAAAAATSSRNTVLRKDETDESFPHQENSPKFNGPLGRAAGHSPLGSRLKETPRSAVVKASQDKPSGIFQSGFSNENTLFCDICRRSETLLNRIFVCSSCKVPVHLDCYRKLKDPIGPWKCELCEEISQLGSPRNQFDNTGSVTQCCLCGCGIGAFRKTTNDQWVHAFCAEWLLESTFTRGQQNHIDGMDAISKEKDLYNCCICHQNFGVCSKCSFGHCQVTFHPYCARIAGFYMNVKTIGGRSHHKAYCEKHSVEQRQKADNQQYGADELKNIKQIRFELERVRLLCERIIKREKVKRDLVLCSNEILAARRDCVAYKMLVRSSYPPGVSSESATTSIDNKSTFSGTFQRSEEATVDSKLSGKRNVKLSLDMDRKTDDSSTSQLSFKRKIPDRTSSSGKQLPHRTSVPSRSSADDVETNIKARKHTETFHKEVVMTSHQASMQNQRLPKGFAYVPIDYVSRGKPLLRDSESHEPEEPGG